MSGTVTAIATAVSAVAADAAAALGASSAVIEGVSTVAYTFASIGVTTGIAAGVGAIFAPKLPSPQALQFPMKQAMPVRQSAFGRVRVGGAYAFYGTGVGTAAALSIDILALLDGRSNAFISFYLNDDLMAPVGDYWYAPGATGKYGGGGSNPPNLVQIDSRLGRDTETSYSEIAPALPLWDASHRGDGVTSMALYCKPARREDQSGDFPNGLPTPSAVIDAQLIYDPRDEAQTQGDKSTYVFSDNPILCLLAYLTDAAGGMGLSYARFIEPAIDFWTAAADECDGQVATSGMHATLLDAAAPGDNKIFLADTAGLSVGMTVQLPTENVVVSGFGLAGEVDLTSDLLYAHSAGELVYWNASGQSTRYRCAGTYTHDTPPGDVIKSILSTFDGWLGQRGDGALVVRTNTVYVPTVVLGDRHITGYQVQHYLPDEQVTNQYVVSYTDPASAFNKAEAGYVQDDLDIAARGTVRSNELYLQWVPSGPQAIVVARSLLARSTQPVRGTITCNLAGLGVMGQRYVGLEISELPDLADAIVEITGKPTIDLSTLSVSFPFVAVGNRSGGAPAAVCFAIDISATVVSGYLAELKSAISNSLALIGATAGGGTVDIAVVAMGLTSSSIVKRAATASDITDIIAWVEALTLTVSNHMDASAGMTAAKSFFDATDSSITDRRIIWIWQGVPDTTSDTTLYPANAAAAQAVLNSMSPVPDCYVTNVEFSDTTWAAYLDNTPADGIAQATTAADMTSRAEQALFGSVSTLGSGYKAPPLGPPSGAPLQPLTAPTITSVTPDYPNSGGGVQGARLSIQLVDPGLGNITWKVQWKGSTDTLWTQLPGPLDASGTPPVILTGLISASGSIDVQVAYTLSSQVSPWSATTTVTVSAPNAATTALTASEALTAGQLVNIWSSSGAKVRKANATDDTRPAHGFVLANVSSSATATIYLPGQVITGLTSLTPGATYYLDTTGGAITATQPSTSGNLVQRVGYALSATTLMFQPEILSEA